MSGLSPEARPRVSALLQRILHGAADRFAFDDADALWRELSDGRLPRFGEVAAGRWRLRRYRLWLHMIVEVEDALAAGQATGGGCARLRYTLFGDPIDLLRCGGRRVDLPVWPGFSLRLMLGRPRPWKRSVIA